MSKIDESCDISVLISFDFWRSSSNAKSITRFCKKHFTQLIKLTDIFNLINILTSCFNATWSKTFLTSSQLDDECSTFRNMTEILKILNIDKYQLKNLTNQVEQWTEKHMSTLKHIRFNEKSTIINEQLTSFLYKINMLMFDDFKTKQIFNILTAVIQWMFYNRRCFEQRRVKKINTFFIHT